MNLTRVLKSFLIMTPVALATSFGWERAIAVERGRTEAEEGVQVLTRGPVHEAFAETVTFDPQPGIMAPKSPPTDIEELPPAQKPDGANVAWIPGYWGWDDDRNDFLWVSGVWRDLPPGRQWVSGYWGKSGQEYQWTAGYWADAKASEVEYLSEPPESVEAGPNVDAPSADQTWIPGCWVWHQSRYAWRPGNWMAMQSDWVWVPAYYVWTPRGYVFVDGYWDYSVARRGVLFAPVYFDASVYSQRGFSYSPATVINPAVFSNCLFLRPGYSHYYFGDYYAESYVDAGFYPRFSFHSRNGYDPIYAHDRWQHRTERGWEHRQETDFRNFRDHEASRPPHTWAAERQLEASRLKSKDKGFVVAASLAELAKSKDSPLRLQPLDKNERQKLVQHGQEVQKFRVQRQEREIKAAGASAATISEQSKPTRLKLPASPIAAKSAGEFGKDQVPPKRYEALKPNLQIEPKPSTPGGKRDLHQRDRIGENQTGARKVRPGDAPTPGAGANPSGRGGGTRIEKAPPQPKIDRPAPRVDRPAPQPQPAPKVQQPAPQAKPQPKVQPPAPQPKAPAAPPATAPKPEKPKG